jgi:manganese-dependent inorganic pyrophosphatase
MPIERALTGQWSFPSADGGAPALVYVTGHRNPDTDSIASAIGYAELKSRIDPSTRYVAVRLGDMNEQTRWALERSGATEPEYLPHVFLRVCDVMRTEFPTARADEPVRAVGLAMAAGDLDLMPIVDEDGALAGVMTERALARRYIRESREVSSLVDTPTTVSAVASVLEGRQVMGDDRSVAGRVWAHSMDPDTESRISEGDVVVVGDRADAQRLAIEQGAGLLITSNGSVPDDEILALAERTGTAVVSSPLDTYVSARMVTLAAPCRGLMDREPLTVSGEDLVAEIAEDVKDVHYRAAVAVDAARRPIGLVTRSDLVGPSPRRVLLVDHAEAAQSVRGIEEAEIIEILDHHHIGSIETRIPVTATFDPVGSTATLVTQRFRQSGLEPSRPTAIMLLAAVLSDTVLLRSPTATERDRAAVAYFEQALGIDATDFGRRMFEDSSDTSGIAADQLVTRDVKEYQATGGQLIGIAQVETIGNALLDRRDELLAAIGAERERQGYPFYALMVTDILSEETQLLVAGDKAAVERAFDQEMNDGVIALPGVISRKKQVAPRLMAAV